MKEETQKTAEAIKDFIVDHKGLETVVLDVSPECSWADFFVISTVSSLGHL